MTTTTDPTRTATDIRGAVAALAPTIKERASEIEALRHLPADLIDELHTTGSFRILLPASHGGAEATLPEAMDVFEALSRADASTGWAVAIAAGVWCDLTGLPRATFDAMYDTPTRLIAGVFSPSGIATEVESGYEISGRWSFASGSPYADWIYGNAIEMIDGTPEFRTILFEPGEVVIEDTWHVLGMRGTASHDFVADHVTVPAARTFATFASEPCVDATIVGIPQPSLFSLLLASLVLGAARGALDDIMELAAGKVPLLAGSPLATNELFQRELARTDTELRSVRALVWACADEIWATVESGSAPSPDLVARTRAAAAWSTTVAVAGAEAAFRFGGGSAIYDDSPLQRRLRDVNVIAQHFLVKPDTLTTAGALLAGQDIDVPVF